MDTANSGKTKWKYVNPELGKKFPSVETLYGVPKAIGYGKEKVQTANINMAMKIVVVWISRSSVRFGQVAPKDQEFWEILILDFLIFM